MTIYSFDTTHEINGVERDFEVTCEYTPGVKSYDYDQPDDEPEIDVISVVETTDPKKKKKIKWIDLPEKVQDAMNEEAEENFDFSMLEEDGDVDYDDYHSDRDEVEATYEEV